MNKKLVFYALSVTLCFCLLFTACSNDLLSVCKSRVSDIRYNYFQGETENYYVSFSSGLRESPYKLDGKSESKVEFGVVTIMPKEKQETKCLSYTVTIDDANFSGEFENSPFDDSYAGDIGKKVEDGSKISVKISDGENEETAELKCLSCDFKVTANQALEIAFSEVQAKVVDIAKHQNFEVYVKIVADIKQVAENKYWLVVFSCECGENVSVIITTDTGKCEVKTV